MADAASPSAASSPPYCRLLVRSKQKLELFTLMDDLLDDKKDNDNSDSTSSNHNNQNKRIVLLDNCTTTTPTCTAPDGSFTLVQVQNVGIVKCSLLLLEDDTPPTPPKPFFAASTQVQMMDMSPRGSYLTTWERYKEDTTTSGNLKVWDCSTGTLLAAFVQKSIASESWPYIQWTYNEQFMILNSNSSQIRIYPVTEIKKNATTTTESQQPRYIDHLSVPGGCTTLSVQRHASMISATTSTTSYYLTTFTKKTKDKPATTTVWSYTPTATSSSTSSSSSSSGAFQKMASKSLFQAEECTTKWCPTHSPPACLITFQTTIDTSGQSYYGNSQLWLWNHVLQQQQNNNSSGSDDVAMIAVPLPQAGPVLDSQWLPDPNKPPSFIVIAGNMPAMTTLHHGITAAVTFVFGNNVSRNTIVTCRHYARFICLAGFGNLAGGMGFWDINKKKLIPHCIANVTGILRSDSVTMCGWAPHNRYFMTATTAPRMNVDNGIRLYKYTGELIESLPWNNKTDYQPNLLLEATFVPVLPHIYPDRPQSPVPSSDPVVEKASNSSNGATVMSGGATIKVPPVAPPPTTTKPASTGGKYVPPSARNRTTANPNSFSERLRAEKEGSVIGATKVVAGRTSAVALSSSQKGVTSALTGRPIPGLTATATTTGGKSKSQLKREKMKLKKEVVAVTTTTTTTATSTTASITTSTSTTTTETAGATAVQPEPAAAALDPEKRARKLKKLLKQIDDLKTIENLNDDQRAKIASEPSLRAELAQLEL